MLVAGCTPQPETAAATFDPCSPLIVAAPSASIDQRASIEDAITMWRSRGVTGVQIGEMPAITITFRDAASAIYGYYDDDSATVYVNLRLEDRTQRAITVAHELGHAFGLGHVAASIRSSVMKAGNVIVPPTDSDAAELLSIWGACR